MASNADAAVAPFSPDASAPIEKAARRNGRPVVGRPFMSPAIVFATGYLAGRLVLRR